MGMHADCGHGMITAKSMAQLHMPVITGMNGHVPMAGWLCSPCKDSHEQLSECARGKTHVL